MATNQNSNGANLGFERELWQAADALRSNMDAAEYKHVVLGLMFLKYISDAFEEQHAKLEAQRNEGADPEDPDEYRAINIFWVPKEARWSRLKAAAKQPSIGKTVDEAMLAIGWIMVVHMFFVHLSPGIFPMNKSIFTGRMPRKKYAEEHPVEYNRLVSKAAPAVEALPAEDGQGGQQQK